MKRHAESRLLLAGAVVPLLAVGSGVTAAQTTVTVPTWTGCYNASSGTINKLQIGERPLKNCSSGELTISFAAGDITKISVSGGLTGGGENGEISIALDPKYGLPQGCAAGDVAKWTGSAWQCSVDSDTTYTSGAGLALSGRQFSITADYQLPQSCAEGQTATRTASGWTCGSGAASLTSAEAKQPAAAGIPDDLAFHSMASVSLSAGTWLVNAKGTVTSERNVTAVPMGCGLSSGGNSFDSMSIGADTLNAVEDIPFALTAIVALTANATLNLNCWAGEGADGVGLEDGHITAVKIR